MGTKVAVAFANIFMAGIEKQTLRQSCIEPHPGHQRIFPACSGILRRRCRLPDLWPEVEVTRGEAARKKLFAWVTKKTLPKRKHHIKGLWAPRVIESLFWKRYIDDVFSL